MITESKAARDQVGLPEDRNEKKSQLNLYGNKHLTRSKGVVLNKEGEILKVGPPRKEKPTETAQEDDPALSLPEKENQSKPDKSGKQVRWKELPYVEIPAIRPSVKESRPIEGINPKLGPAYKNKAPVEDEIDIEDLVKKALDVEITIPLRSLAGASTVVRDEIRKQVTRIRKSLDKTTLATMIADDGQEYIDVASIPVATFTPSEDVTSEIPEGHLVADDPVLQYLKEIDGADLDKLLVAKISEPLRCIYSVVNHTGQEECLLDSGSQIVSMGKEVATTLGLTWDPNIRINMESASSHIEKTLGLARNVPFTVGGITIYLQVHILENPPYKVLLGRPFEILVTSTVKTESDGTTLVTIIDPNTKRQATIPAYERGKGPEELRKQKVQSF